MKFKDIAKGVRAIKRVPLPLVNVPSELAPDQPELAARRQADHDQWEADKAAQPEQAPPSAPDSTPEVGLQVLTGDEAAEVYDKAWRWAKKHGAEHADENDPIYNLAVSVYTCARGCVDPDSDPEHPELFFGASVDEAARVLFATEHIGRDGIVYLAEAHETWQDMCNPQALKMTPDQMFAEVGAIATREDGLNRFLGMRPGLRWSFMRFTASALWSALQDKSPSSSASGESTSKSSGATSDGSES